MIVELDGEVRRRLGRRYGSSIDAWLDGLPTVLADLAERWQLDRCAVIQRGSVSVVIRCRTADERRAVLKVCPDRPRLAREAAALALWRTPHVPAVLAVDERAGALLIEAIEPGTPLDETVGYPSLERLGALLTALHAGAADDAFPSLTDRVEQLFESSRKLYELAPSLVELAPPDLYERSRELALRLAADAPRTVLHGDLTPVNVLDGGDDRGLVAVDPAPCLGDPAFDAVDLVVWRADDVETIVARAEQVAPAIGADAGRLLDWCAAFAPMSALEVAERDGRSAEQLRPLLALASRL